LVVVIRGKYTYNVQEIRGNFSLDVMSYFTQKKKHTEHNFEGNRQQLIKVCILRLYILGTSFIDFKAQGL